MSKSWSFFSVMKLQGKCSARKNDLLLSNVLEDNFEYFVIVSNVDDETNLDQQSAWIFASIKKYKIRVIDWDRMPHKQQLAYEPTATQLNRRRLIFRNSYRSRARFLLFQLLREDSSAIVKSAQSIIRFTASEARPQPLGQLEMTHPSELSSRFWWRRSSTTMIIFCRWMRWMRKKKLRTKQRDAQQSSSSAQHRRHRNPTGSPESRNGAPSGVECGWRSEGAEYGRRRICEYYRYGLMQQEFLKEKSLEWSCCGQNFPPDNISARLRALFLRCIHNRYIA